MALDVLMVIAGTVTVAALAVTLLLPILFRAGFRPTGRLRRLIVAFLLVERFPTADPGKDRARLSL